MNSHNTDPTRKPSIIADWVKTLESSVRQSLDRMDHTLTLAEAKLALIRDLRARRQQREDPNSQK